MRTRGEVRGGLAGAICMRQYCFNGTADLRLLWELRAGMRTGERMCGDLRTESFLSFFEVSCGLDSPSEREAFICLLYDDRQKTLLHTELKCSYFVNGALPSSYFCSSMNSKTFCLVILNHYYQQKSSQH